MNKGLLSTNDVHPWSVFKHDLWDLFDRFSGDFETPSRQMGFTPRMEVKDLGKTYQVSLEVPGMEEKDINLTVRENYLIAEGEKKQEEQKEDKKGLFLSEFSYGRFFRSIALPEDVNTENVNATYRNGILTVNFEKLEKASKSRKIEIKSSTSEAPQVQTKQ